MTAAFAALNIILVQVHHDLTYIKALKDSDRISLGEARNRDDRFFHEKIRTKPQALSKE